MSVTNILTFGKFQKIYGWQLADGACALTAQFTKLTTSTEFPLTGNSKWSWGVKADAQKLIDTIKERADFLGSSMTCTANAGESVLNAANFAKLQQVYTTATNIQYLLHPTYKGGNQSASGVTFTNNNFPTFKELNTSNGTIDEGSYQWWYELCKFAGLITTDSETGAVTWGFSYRNTSGNIVRPGSSGLNTAGLGADALRVVTAGDPADITINKLIISELLALASIEHSQKIKVLHTGASNSVFSDSNTVETITVGTKGELTISSDCDAQQGLAVAGGFYGTDRWDQDCALGNDGGSTNNPFSTNDVRGNHWFATNNTASINAVVNASKSKSAYCFNSTDANYKADSTASSAIGSGTTFMDLELELAAGQLAITGNRFGGFRARSRGQQTLGLGTANVPVLITSYQVYIENLSEANQVFLGNQSDATASPFALGWNTIDISSTVSSGIGGTPNAGMSFIDNLTINPVDNADMLITKVPQFQNSDFTTMTSAGFPRIGVIIADIANLVGAEEDNCVAANEATEITITINDLDNTQLSINSKQSGGIVHFANAGIQLNYVGLFAPTSTGRVAYDGSTVGGNNLPEIVNTDSEITSFGYSNNTAWTGTLEALGPGSSQIFTDAVTLKISRDNYFEDEITATEGISISCNVAVSTSSTTTTTAQQGS